MSTRIYYAGDSIVAQKSIYAYPETGIGQALPLYFKQECKIQNHAINGRSTKSFIDESRLAAIYNDIREGDFLFIQFGHNDEKKEDPTRYTDPFGEYQVNLEKFINVARNRKAYPVLLTPLCRRHFDENGALKDTHGDYPEAVRQTGARLNVPVIDLCELSRQVLTETGDENSKKWFMNFPAGLYDNYPEGKADNSHLRYEGAIVFAGLIAKELKKLGGVYAELLLEGPEKPLSTAVEP
ncbi:MAG: rhamnogalacturonan acetylesterase [Lachnospiraceae bacterium]|nr:rhamnogalacturonan acetylesterase [Lachnospiraceae bacterium]